MQESVRVVFIENGDEDWFLNFLGKDKVLHVFTISDLKYLREKTRVWAAFKNDSIWGYLFEFDKRIIHTHGTMDSIVSLLGRIDLNEPTFIIEPHHKQVVTHLFEPTEPTDSSSKTKITTYYVMKLDVHTFKPLIRHHVEKLTTENLREVLDHLGEERKERIENVIRSGGIAFGAYEKGFLAAMVTVSEFADNIALIRGVYTIPSMRNRGLATSASSALVEELISLGKEPILWVAKDNLPARKVYKKIGFKKTEYILLGFKAKKT